MNMLTVIDIHERDIDSRLCQRCGACCRVYVIVPGADSRFRRYLRATGATVLPPLMDGDEDCCSDPHDIQVDLGWCQHLEVSSDECGETYRCKIHGSAEFPALCAQFNCVSWAKCSDAYDSSNALLVQAQGALTLLREQAAKGIAVRAHDGVDQEEKTPIIVERPVLAVVEKPSPWWIRLLEICRIRSATGRGQQ